MLKENSYYFSLLADYINGTASRSQLAELLDYIKDYPREYNILVNSPEIAALLETKQEDSSIIISEASSIRMKQRLLDGIMPARIIPVWKRIAAAAAVLFIVSLGAYFIANRDKKSPVIAKVTVSHDIPAPSYSKATIKLVDGTIIPIDSLNILTQGNAKLVKNANGEIAYESSGNNSSPSGEAGVSYNTLTNPRGSKPISLTLSDGSQVWLNAESSLIYPVAFTGSERKVSITGEAYFEVAHNAASPFKVSKGDMEVTVLGTHFNVNAYDDEESIKVTLLEGSVKLTTTNDQRSTILKPGQQAVLTNNGQLTTNNDINLDEVMAWKEGFFHFESADLETILKQLARWYDIEVVYEGPVSSEKYFSIMNRNTTLLNVLKQLQANKIKFRVEGKKLVVSG